jgi:hypothetical protein
VSPWLRSRRVVSADSYFASVKAARLRQLGLRFIGVVKSATKEFHMSYLSRLELNNRGERKALVAHDEFGRYLAFVWMDRERRNFIATAGSMLPGKPCN